MNRYSFSLCSIIFSLCFLLEIKAVPAYPYGVTFTQPDGSTIELYQRGDEFFHWTETQDGAIVFKANEKEYQYAKSDSLGRLSPSGMMAKSLNSRTIIEQRFITSLNQKAFFKNRKDTTRLQLQIICDSINSNRVQTRATTTPKYLIVLVEFSDVFFQIENTLDKYKQVMNDLNYPSARRYFKDNSMGAFDPEFTVVGPVRLNKSYKYYGENNENNEDKYSSTMVREACAAISSSVNFAEYDANNDGYVDNIYIIYAGFSENYTNSDPNTIWPHRFYLRYSGNMPVYNTKKIDQYSCSGELVGVSGKIRSGIGTFCHEFSHTLGLLDMYDTDYKGSGGEAYHLNEYSIMASGNYLNGGNTPSSYTAYERESLKWGVGEELKIEGTKSLPDLGSSNKFYRINTSNPNEYFLLENRQQIGWDKYLSGHGMLIYHIDKSNPDASFFNTLNANPLHQYVDIEEADNIRKQGSISSYQGDPFPGITENRSFTDETVPGMRLWNNTPVRKPIYNIQEIDEVVYFDFLNATSIPTPVFDQVIQIHDNSFTLSWKGSQSIKKYEIEVSRLIGELPHEDHEYGFDNFPLLPSNWISDNIDSYTSSFNGYYGAKVPALKFASSESVLTTQTYERPISLFSFTTIGAGAGSMDSYMNIEGLKQSEWIEIGSIKNTADGISQFINIDKKSEPLLPDSITALRFSYNKIRGNMSFDDLKIRVGEESSVVIDGYNGKDVGNTLSTTVTALSPNTRYSFRVRGVNGSIKSAYCSPVIIKTSNTSSLIPLTKQGQVNIHYRNPFILINDPIGNRTASIYSLSGELLLQQKMTSGENLISFNSPGFYIICIGEQRYKIVIL